MITLRVHRDDRDPVPPEGASLPDAAASVVLEVEDSGPGMDPATLERAGHPGFTTKSSGSGLGLTLVQRIVEQHGGRFELASTPGAGTRAVITVPAAATALEASAAPGAPGASGASAPTKPTR